MRAGRWPAHQLNELPVKLFLVQVLLDFHERFAHARLLAGSPRVSVAVGRAVIHFNIDIEFLPPGDDARIEPGRRGKLIP